MKTFGFFPINVNSKAMSTAQHRQKAIVELLSREGGRLSVNSLSERLGVSSVTIRQDLRVLAGDRVVDRVYGGAVLRAGGAPLSELSFEARAREATRQKDAIGRHAAALVKPGYGIALDGSTTACALVPYLKQIANLTIVTNSLIVAQQLRDAESHTVLMTSGRLRRESATIVGTLNGLPPINLNLGFFGAWGVSLIAGITDVNPEEVRMRQVMIEHCLETIIVVDGRKMGEVAPYTYATLDRISRIITDDSAPPHVVSDLCSQWVTVDVVPVSRS